MLQDIWHFLYEIRKYLRYLTLIGNMYLHNYEYETNVILSKIIYLPTFTVNEVEGQYTRYPYIGIGIIVLYRTLSMYHSASPTL